MQRVGIANEPGAEQDIGDQRDLLAACQRLEWGEHALDQRLDFDGLNQAPDALLAASAPDSFRHRQITKYRHIANIRPASPFLRGA